MCRKSGCLSAWLHTADAKWKQQQQPRSPSYNTVRSLSLPPRFPRSGCTMYHANLPSSWSYLSCFLQCQMPWDFQTPGSSSPTTDISPFFRHLQRHTTLPGYLLALHPAHKYSQATQQPPSTGPSLTNTESYEPGLKLFRNFPAARRLCSSRVFSFHGWGKPCTT